MRIKNIRYVGRGGGGGVGWYKMAGCLTPTKEAVFYGYLKP